MTVEVNGRPSIGEVLKGLRKEAGMTLRGVAEAIGRDHTTIAHAESGHDRAWPPLLRALADLYKVDVNELYEVAGWCPHCEGTGKIESA